MGKVLLTTEAFKEKRVANEIENILAMRGIDVFVRVFDNFSGVILVESSSVTSQDLSRTLINIAHVRRVVRTIIPILAEYRLEHLSYDSVVVLVIEDFLPRVDLSVLENATFCVRCRFRGMRGESRTEKILGYYIKQIVPSSKVRFKHPDYVLLVETVGDWCGIYFGRNDTSVLIYPEVQR